MIWHSFWRRSFSPFPCWAEAGCRQRSLPGFWKHHSAVLSMSPPGSVSSFKSEPLKRHLFSDTAWQNRSVAHGAILKLPSLRAPDGPGISYTCQELKHNTQWHLERKYCDSFYFCRNTQKRDGVRRLGADAKGQGKKIVDLSCRKSLIALFQNCLFSLLLFSMFPFCLLQPLDKNIENLLKEKINPFFSEM